ncbi:o-succinylbenzoate synthase [Chryseobacterium bernardetii]|uniref:o-succinylbenzoate synthase n=2 Tax=Chryseobacterium TaxID=59732 RepID=A0A543EMB6_9FLAO|nr:MULTISPECIES: o-succinylbenzoate synthase [Chryseobacterium]MDR6369051.1 o-succinylbenzoate synthase [Chryseobacterium vietnamense]MDR6440026.1 o-succinylbenzoate synthase [Chryseobacterium bernardetii]TQM22659.1 o-succinylbenzoate synthase [Chryseobacterium aquifrigidense]
MEAKYLQYLLQFKRPSGTSRGVLLDKETFILTISEEGRKGVGECAIFRGLSFDDRPDYEEKLQWLCKNINQDSVFLKEELKEFPSIWFGYEQAIQNLKYGDSLYFPSEFTEEKSAITINGLIWMGDAAYMEEQIQEKLDKGFHCIKLKIGVDWKSEHVILQKLREKFSKDQLELRVDANGGFSKEEALLVLQQLADLHIHSIEQPIKAGNWDDMVELCSKTPTPIALDEELIGIIDPVKKKQLLEKIQPQYIILKPALVGGFSGSDEWISLAENQNIGWWITSALESNIGLNAIAQYTFTKKNPMPQGLGTGALFVNNFESDLELRNELLWFKK